MRAAGLDRRRIATEHGTYDAGGLELVVRPPVTGRTRRDKSSAHRVFVACPYCPGRTLVPVGRVHQHKHRGMGSKSAERIQRSLGVRPLRPSRRYEG